MAQVSAYKVDTLVGVKPEAIVALKVPNKNAFELYVTNKQGVPFPLNVTSSSGAITSIQNTDGNLTITGTDTIIVNISEALLATINSALQAGDDISSLVNDADYITLADVPTFIPSDYDLEDFTNTGVDPFVHVSEIESFVPYTGAEEDVDLGEFQLKAGQIELDQTPTGTFSTAKIRWNDTAGTAEIRLKGNNVTLQLGQELVKRVVNKTVTNITLQESNYQAVKIVGATGQRLSVDLAQADSEINSSTTIGLVTENIANNQEGFITFSGEVNSINTTGSLQGETWVDGDVLYLSPTVAGQLTKVAPTAPNHTIKVGYVQYAHATQGKIHVDVDTGYSLNNLHNVAITGTTANKVLGSVTEGLWENKTIGDILGYVPQVRLVAGANINIDETNPLSPIINADVTSNAVGIQQNFYLDSTASVADNFTLSNTPSIYPETADFVSVTTGLTPVFFERFISQPLGKTSIAAGTWKFNIYASTSNNSGLNTINYRVNKRVIVNGIVGTWTGTGIIRTFTALSGTPFAGLITSGNRLTAPLIETPNQTGWVAAVVSSTVVTVNITDISYVNETGVSLNAVYYWLFGGTSVDITGSTPTLYIETTVQPEFTGLNLNDRLVIAFFASTDQASARTMTLYYGGTENFTYFESPLSLVHNDLDGLQGGQSGEYYHLNLAEKTNVGEIPNKAPLENPTFTGSVVIPEGLNDEEAVNFGQIKIDTGANPSITTVTVGGIPSGTDIQDRTFESLLTDILIAYLYPQFTSQACNYPSTVEVGTTVSGSGVFTWAISNGTNIVDNSVNIFDLNANDYLVTGLANDGSQTVTLNGLLLNTNNATQVWNISAENTKSEVVESGNIVTTAKFRRFFGATSATPTTGTARSLGSEFQSANAQTFTLNTGSTLTKFAVCLPSGVTISSVIDLDALNLNITSNYVLLGTININDIGGTSRVYNLYEMNIGAPYSSNHRHQITTI